MCTVQVLSYREKPDQQFTQTYTGKNQTKVGKNKGDGGQRKNTFSRTTEMKMNLELKDQAQRYANMG